YVDQHRSGDSCVCCSRSPLGQHDRTIEDFTLTRPQRILPPRPKEGLELTETHRHDQVRTPVSTTNALGCANCTSARSEARNAYWPLSAKRSVRNRRLKPVRIPIQH